VDQRRRRHPRVTVRAELDARLESFSTGHVDGRESVERFAPAASDARGIAAMSM